MPKLARKGGNDLVSEIKNTFSNVEPLSYVCAAVIVLYIAIAKPSNTPSFFGHPAFKAVLFIVVFLVTMMDPVIGILFGLAMVLSVSYSQKSTQEGFFVDDDPDDPEDNMTQSSKVEPHYHDGANRPVVQSGQGGQGGQGGMQSGQVAQGGQSDMQDMQSGQVRQDGEQGGTQPTETKPPEEFGNYETFTNYSDPAPMNNDSFAPFPNM